MGKLGKIITICVCAAAIIATGILLYIYLSFDNKSTKSLTITLESMQIEVGSKSKISYTVNTEENDSALSISFSVTDEKIARIENDFVKGIAVGTTYLRANAKIGNKTANSIAKITITNSTGNNNNGGSSSGGADNNHDGKDEGADKEGGGSSNPSVDYKDCKISIVFEDAKFENDTLYYTSPTAFEVVVTQNGNRLDNLEFEFSYSSTIIIQNELGNYILIASGDGHVEIKIKDTAYKISFNVKKTGA